MKKRFGLIVLVILGMAGSAMAQDIRPVWEHLFTEANPPLLILKAESAPTADDRFDGTATLDTYGGFKRYDANRLLLGIRENGINESDPNHNSQLAAQYPDRSLIWINPSDGSPMGVALVVGRHPVTLDADFTGAGGTLDDFYINFGVSDDGVIFVGYKNKVLRYAPDGQGGFSAPTVAYTHQNDGSANWYHSL